MEFRRNAICGKLTALILCGLAGACASKPATGGAPATSTPAVGPAAQVRRPRPHGNELTSSRFEIKLCTENVCGEKTVSVFFQDGHPVASREDETSDAVVAEIEPSLWKDLWQRIDVLPSEPAPVDLVAQCKASFRVRIVDPSSDWKTPICRTHDEVSKTLSYIVRDIDFTVLKNQVEGRTRRTPTGEMHR